MTDTRSVAGGGRPLPVPPVPRPTPNARPGPPGPPARAPYRSGDMPLLTHDETGAASVAKARAVAVAERPGRGRAPKNAPKTTEPRTTWQRVRRWLWIFLALIVIGPLLAFFVGWLIFTVPSVEDTALTQTATFTFSDGAPLATVRPENVNRVKITLDKVPEQVKRAVLAAEDRTFYSNPGFDITGIARAVWNQLTGGAWEAAPRSPSST